MIRPILFYLNAVDLKFYPFMISLDKCSGGYNSAVEDFSTKICVQCKTKDINVKVFNMTTYNNESKKIVKNISYGCKHKSNSTTCNSNQKWKDKACQCDCKNYRTCKKNDGILAHVFEIIVSI